MKVRFFWCLQILFFLTFWGALGSTAQNATPPPPLPSAMRFDASPPSFGASLSPNRILAGQVDTYQLAITIGEGGVAAGGSIRAYFPKNWFGSNARFPLASVSLACSRSGSSFTMKADPVALQGTVEKKYRSLTITLSGESLQEGDVVTLTLSNVGAPAHAGVNEIVVVFDTIGNEGYCMPENGAQYEIIAGPTGKITIVAPSQAVVGQPTEMQVTLYDKHYNLARTIPEDIIISGLDSNPVFLPDASSEGRLIFQWTPLKKGFQWPQVQATLRNLSWEGEPGSPVSFQAKGSPVRVFNNTPPFNVYWGEVHSHSAISWDASGDNDFYYARYVSRLDFFSSTEHAEEHAVGDYGDDFSYGITADEWSSIIQKNKDYYEPGLFATLLAFECAMGSGSGHHNIYFRSLDGAPIPAWYVNSTERLLSYLTPGEAFAIPHHTGVIFKTGISPYVEWQLFYPKKRPLIEIFSNHGSSEMYKPEDSLSYEKISGSESMPGPHYARDAWRSGQKLGVVAGSDNHLARPGLPNRPLTAVITPALTREAIFDAMGKRHTYASTGPRVYMEFRMDGSLMGEQKHTSKSIINGYVILAAPGKIARANVVRLDLKSGVYQNVPTVKSWKYDGKYLRATLTEQINKGDRYMYYVRAQLAGSYSGRVARVWSSPIWISGT